MSNRLTGGKCHGNPTRIGPRHNDVEPIAALPKLELRVKLACPGSGRCVFKSGQLRFKMIRDVGAGPGKAPLQADPPRLNLNLDSRSLRTDRRASAGAEHRTAARRDAEPRMIMRRLGSCERLHGAPPFAPCQQGVPSAPLADIKISTPGPQTIILISCLKLREDVERERRLFLLLEEEARSASSDTCDG
jgi:hypothetical protein